jgi:Bacterial PH domain
MRREFAVTPPDLRLVLLLPTIILLVGLVGIGFAAREAPQVWSAAVVFVLVIALLVWSIQWRHIVLEGDRLSIRAGMNSVRLRVADLDLAAARIVDLAQTPTLRPMLKTFGASMPGFHAGHFRLRDRSRAFLLLTDRSKVLALPQRNGRTLLLSLERPQALLDALKTVAEAPARR